MSVNILVVEDDIFLREGLCEMLKKEGYNVEAGDCVADALALFEKSAFDLVILDIGLPDGSGFDLCKFLRDKNSTIPILFLSAFNDEFQIVRGLDSGADDYVTKPFKMLELLSRIRALLRRNKSTVFNCKELSVDLDKFIIKKDGETILVTPTELQIVTTLIKNKGTIVTRNMLLEKIWDCGSDFIDDNTLSVHISRLREKIGGKYIVTVRGIGYRWEDGE